MIHNENNRRVYAVAWTNLRNGGSFISTIKSTDERVAHVETNNKFNTMEYTDRDKRKRCTIIM